MNKEDIKYTDYMLLLNNKTFFLNENEKTNFFLENMNTSVSSGSNNNNPIERNKNNINNSLTEDSHKDETIQLNLSIQEKSQNLIGKKRKGSFNS